LKVGCIVLAGGRSSRLGRDKVTERLGGLTLLERTISTVTRFSSEVIVVGANSSLLPCNIVDSRVRMVSDLHEGKGPLAGIHSGLTSSHFQHNFVVACDTPFLNTGLIDYMLGLCQDFDAVVPRVKDLLEPLQAIYSKNCLPVIEDLLKNGKLRIMDLLEVTRVKFVEEAEIDRFDPTHLCFFNINTEADLTTARRIAEGKRND
jgi:molybdopterin-guanine dinucleotide biosynthesis protein A